VPNAFIDERVELFDFGRSPFTPERVEEIQTRRSLMQDELFIDYMLRNAGIERPTELFPPSSKETIRETLTAVKNAENPSLRLECIVYYLLSWWNDGSHDNFCVNKRIPSGFAELTYAYYLFDSGDCIVRV
jgi:Nuclear pore complex assembly